VASPSLRFPRSRMSSSAFSLFSCPSHPSQCASAASKTARTAREHATRRPFNPLIQSISQNPPPRAQVAGGPDGRSSSNLHADSMMPSLRLWKQISQPELWRVNVLSLLQRFGCRVASHPHRGPNHHRRCKHNELTFLSGPFEPHEGIDNNFDTF
jgi:hypothetical protein